MKKVTITLYKFDELSQEGQKNALKKYWDIQLMEDWYTGIYEDAQNVGLKITGFDVSDKAHCDIEFEDNSLNVAERIEKEHAVRDASYKAATNFLKGYDNIHLEHSDRDELIEALESEFKQELSTYYLKCLKVDYEYLSSEDAIKECFEDNDYYFEQDGTMNNKFT